MEGSGGEGENECPLTFTICLPCFYLSILISFLHALFI